MRTEEYLSPDSRPVRTAHPTHPHFYKMKFFESQQVGEYDFDFSSYQRYLQEHRDLFPPDVYAFAIDTGNYDLRSHQSLHDAWLERFCISEPASGERSEIRTIQIEASFLGPYHDLKIHLVYSGVIEYSIMTPQDFAHPPFATIGHGDLLIHEVSLTDDNQAVVHEWYFSRGSVFRIVCKTFRHSVETIK
ncbi:hypothetical protein UNDYM_4226 [Undibacterium sp. YM2]|uniref:hypothetical protein n=1 Tax=Undibacterium sp. YM2 TaxID=2058625 RepID=UPI001331CB3E|nr:hypothetical protein [Undibacterium sp. YM2]BBB68479.1 hypothetical protein UNDYM_4226 [Undibacterium sp. YM2]